MENVELNTAIDACKKAGKVLLDYFNKPLNFVDKGNSNFVSEADLAAEKIILDTLKEKFPDYAFYSEESKFSDNKSKNMWIIDPLDGTTNFALGSPNFAISITLLKENELVLGVIYHPFLDILIHAEKDKGAYINGKKIQREIKPEFVSVIAGYPSQHLQKEAVYNLTGNVKRILTNWAPAVDFLMLSTGKIDSIITLESEAEDQLAGLLIAKEAGFSIKDLNGKNFIFDKFSEFLPSLIISKSKEHHDHLSKIISLNL